jgi:hypothetical protein
MALARKQVELSFSASGCAPSARNEQCGASRWQLGGWARAPRPASLAPFERSVSRAPGSGGGGAGLHSAALRAPRLWKKRCPPDSCPVRRRALRAPANRSAPLLPEACGSGCPGACVPANIDPGVRTPRLTGTRAIVCPRCTRARARAPLQAQRFGLGGQERPRSLLRHPKWRQLRAVEGAGAHWCVHAAAPAQALAQAKGADVACACFADIVMNNLSPVWTNGFVVDHLVGEIQHLRFTCVQAILIPACSGRVADARCSTA